MINKSISICFLILFSFFSCEENEIVNSDKSIFDDKIVVDENLYENAPSDVFTFKNVEIENNCLIVKIEYGGGCGKIELNLYDSGKVMESYPVQRNIRLSLKDEDYCKALITKEFSFDLTPIKLGEHDKIILNLLDWNDRLIYEY